MRMDEIVLIVDDEEQTRAFFRDVAEDNGLKTAESASYDEITAAHEQAAPALILLDLTMPGMDGIEALRDLADRGSRARIVLTSGQDRRVLMSARRFGLELGLDMADVLQKPVDLAELEARFAELRSQSHQPLTSQMLEDAIEREEFMVFYQPKVDLRAEAYAKVIGAEALIRWRHPERGLIPPDDFLPLAESLGMMRAITEMLTRRVAADMAAWCRSGPALPISINLSPSQLTDLDLPDRLAAQFTGAGLDPSRLVVEVTEQVVMADTRKAADILTRMRLKNISVSLDDFGTGYSSLAELYRLPLNELKLDRSLIRDVDQDRDARIVVRAILALARELGIPVCAEGIETEATARFLRSLDCPTGQGFLFFRPMPADGLAPILAELNARGPAA